jgi:hypothetical protein
MKKPSLRHCIVVPCEYPYRTWLDPRADPIDPSMQETKALQMTKKWRDYLIVAFVVLVFWIVVVAVMLLVPRWIWAG